MRSGYAIFAADESNATCCRQAGATGDAMKNNCREQKTKEKNADLSYRILFFLLGNLLTVVSLVDRLQNFAKDI